MITNDDILKESDNYFLRALQSLQSTQLVTGSVFGSILSYNGQVIETSPLPGIIGSLCTISSKNNEDLKGEIVARHNTGACHQKST